MNKIELKQLSDRVLRGYRRIKNNDFCSMYSTDITELGEKLIGLDIDYRKLSFDNSILGLTSFSEFGIAVIDEKDEEEIYFLDGKTILIDISLSELGQTGRKNFTIAHEISHQIINMMQKVKKTNRNVKYCMSAKIHSFEEWEANYLASLLLMPKDSILHFMSIYGLQNKIHCIDKLWFKEEYQAFCGMARCMGVSKQALLIRMKELGLVENEHLSTGYSFMDIFND